MGILSMLSIIISINQNIYFKEVCDPLVFLGEYKALSTWCLIVIYFQRNDYSLTYLCRMIKLSCYDPLLESNLYGQTYSNKPITARPPILARQVPKQAMHQHPQILRQSTHVLSWHQNILRRYWLYNARLYSYRPWRLADNPRSTRSPKRCHLLNLEQAFTIPYSG